MNEPRSRTPPALKWALNERAVLAVRVTELRQRVARLSAALHDAEQALAALDAVIPKLSAHAVEPDALGPVREQGVRYGERGALGRFVASTLQSLGAAGISAPELRQLVEQHFGLTFDSDWERKVYLDNVLRPELKRLARAGMVEQVPV